MRSNVHDALLPQIALTFDDGPHPKSTNKLLDIAADLGVKLTFFVVGRCVERHARILRRIANDGHEIGNHSWSHPQLSKISVSELRSEIEDTHRIIFLETGVVARLLRPPYGDLSPSQKLLIENELGYIVVYWNFDTRDWKIRDSQLISQVVESGVSANSIILLHDTISETIDAMSNTLVRLQERYKLITLSKLRCSLGLT